MYSDFLPGDMVTLTPSVGSTDLPLADEHRGRIAVFIRYVKPHYYARIAFYGDAKGHTYLVHPESMTLHHRAA